MKGSETIPDIASDESMTSSARKMANLIRKHHSIWGHSRMSGFNSLLINTATHNLLKHLNTDEDLEALKMLAFAQRELGRRWLFAQKMFESTRIPGVALSV